MSGVVMALAADGRSRDAADLADEFIELVDSLGDPTLSVALFYAPTYSKLEAGEVRQALRLAERTVELAAGDPRKGNLVFSSPLAMAMGLVGITKMCLGMPGWQADADAAIAVAAEVDPAIHVMTHMWKYVLSIPFGALSPDATALQETADALAIAEQTGDEVVLGFALLTNGFTQLHHGGPDRENGIALLTRARDSAEGRRFVGMANVVVEPELAREKVRNGDVDGAIEMARTVVERSYSSGEMIWRWLAVTALVEALLAHGTDIDVQEAQAAIDRLAAVPTEEGFVLHELTLLRLRGLVALAHGDEADHDEFMERLRAKALALGFETLAASVPSAT
jgi:hypothetical protein